MSRGDKTYHLSTDISFVFHRTYLKLSYDELLLARVLLGTSRQINNPLHGMPCNVDRVIFVVVS